MSTASKTKLANVLLAEDSLADIDITIGRMKAERVSFNLFPVRNGEDVLSFLYKDGDFKDAVTPDLVFLDLSIPKKNGIEILRHVGEEPELANIPIVVVSGSDNADDINSAMELGAKHYITKPLNYLKIQEAVDLIDSLHFETENEEKILIAK